MSTTQEKTLTIDGMSCDHCVSAVRSALESLEAVTVDTVEVGAAKVAFDPSEISRNQIGEAIADAGFELVE